MYLSEFKTLLMILECFPGNHVTNEVGSEVDFHQFLWFHKTKFHCMQDWIICQPKYCNHCGPRAAVECGGLQHVKILSWSCIHTCNVQNSCDSMNDWCRGMCFL
jgi:hypothetical protein